MSSLHSSLSRGRDYEDELVAYVADPGSLATPVYDPDSQSGQDDTSHSFSDLVQGSGLKCLPDDIVGKDLTLDNKLKVINSLVFATPLLIAIHMHQQMAVMRSPPAGKAKHSGKGIAQTDFSA